MFIIAAVISLIAVFPRDVSAQAPGSYAVFDVEPFSGGIRLVVGLQPLAAATLVRIPDSATGTTSVLDIIRANGELVSAFVSRHAAITQDGTPCAWEPDPAVVPETPLDAEAEGVTVSGLLTCPNNSDAFVIATDLFTELNGHTNLVRVKTSDSYAVISALNGEEREAVVDLRRDEPVSVTGERRPATAIALAVLIPIAIAILSFFTRRRKTPSDDRAEGV